MDQSLFDAANLVIGGLAGATFLWIGLRVLIEGEWHAEVTRALAATTLALAAYLYGELLAGLYPAWAGAQARLWWWAIGIAGVGWYAVAIYHTRSLLSPERWRGLQGWLLLLGAWAAGQALAGSLRPDLFFSSRLGPGGRAAHDQGTWLYLLSVAQVQAPLLAALLVYTRIRRRFRGRGYLRWFTSASACAIAGALLLEAHFWLGAELGGWLPLLSLASMLTLLICAAFLLGSITTNHKLLGRPIGARDLFLRWGIMVAVIVAGIVMLAWGNLAERPVDFVALIVLTPIISAAFDWNSQRVYRRNIAQSRRLIHASISSWPLFDPQVCRAQAQNLLDALADELEADSCYVRLQANPADEPFVLHSGRSALKQSVSPPKGTDARIIAVNQHQLGFIALRGPKAVAYSTLELDLAEACAYSIAGLYLDSRQAQALEQLVVRREHEREEHNEKLQRVLHDQVIGNLDTVHKAVMLLANADAELTSEIREATLESMVLIRGLLRDELADLYPPSLLQEGLIAALRDDLLPRYAGRRYSHMTIVIDADGLDDAVLGHYLTDDLKRLLYGVLDEAIRNASKYAGGDQHRPFNVAVRLAMTHLGLLAEVTDNGVGFVPELASPEGDGMGLRYHQAALRMAGGAMTVKSQVGQGSTVHVHLPVQVLQGSAGPRRPDRPPSLIARSGIEWRRCILESERHPSGRYLINDDPSDLTRPYAVIEHHARRQLADELEIQELIAIDTQRQQTFERYVRSYPFRDLVDRRRLERYISTGKTDEGFAGVGIALACEHARHVVQLLRDHDHYQLALSDQDFDDNFAVKPGYAVLLERRAENGDGRIQGIYKGIRDTNPATVADFTRQFEQAWEAVSPLYRDKRQVIGWLEARLAEAGSGLPDAEPAEEHAALERAI